MLNLNVFLLAAVFATASTNLISNDTRSLKGTPIAAHTIGGSEVAQRFGTAIFAAGDIDGDGLADFYVRSSSYRDQILTRRTGEHHLVFGSLGMSNKARTTLDIISFIDDSNLDNLGTSVSAIGDINSDGYDDLLFGQFRRSSSGIAKPLRSRIFYGKPNARQHTPIRLSRVPAYKGSAAKNIRLASGSYFIDIGDVNKDNSIDFLLKLIAKDDLDIGGHHQESVILFGTEQSFADNIRYAGPLRDVRISALNRRTTHRFAAGDFDGDSNYELALVEKKMVTDNKAARTHFRVLHGDFVGGIAGSYTPLSDIIADMAEIPMPGAVSRSVIDLTAGDVNNDGIDDLLLGFQNNEGVFAKRSHGVLIKYGSAASIKDGFQLKPASNSFLVLDAGSTPSSFGSSVALVGDMNGDGYQDFAIGEPKAHVREMKEAGRVLIVNGPIKQEDGLRVVIPYEQTLPNSSLEEGSSENTNLMYGENNGYRTSTRIISIANQSTATPTDLTQIEGAINKTDSYNDPSLPTDNDESRAHGVNSCGRGSNLPFGSTDDATVENWVKLSWSAPSERVDGSPLDSSDISRYKVTCFSKNLEVTSFIINAKQSGFELVDLNIGTYQFEVQVVDTNGVHSAPSIRQSKTITAKD